jgi:hypothetical protein
MNIDTYIFSNTPDIREVPYGEYTPTQREEQLLAELSGTGWIARRMIADCLPYWELVSSQRIIREIVLSAAVRQALGGK